MINTEKLNQVISAYKENFSKHFEKERYKWNAVKCFQENWDIETDDCLLIYLTRKEMSLIVLISS